MITEFNKQKINKIKSLCIKTLLKRKNIYLIKAKGIDTPYGFVNYITEATLISSEETQFGAQLEQLAIYINEQIYGGWKSGIEGIDLEFENNNIRNIVSIKSGPFWGNSSQIAKMRDNFKTAQKTIRTNNNKNIHICSVNGCCYGIDNRPDKGDYFKYCGQRFWKFISNNDNTFIDILDSIKSIKETKLETDYNEKLRELIHGFEKDFCNENGTLMWEKMLIINSAQD